MLTGEVVFNCGKIEVGGELREPVLALKSGVAELRPPARVVIKLL
jgi:hypothetical protein